MPQRRGTQGGCVVAVVILVCLAPVGAVAATAGGGANTPSVGSQETGSVTVSSYSVPDTVTLHRNFTVEATVNNTRSTTVEKTVRVERARDRLWSTIATHNVTMPANTEKTVSFNATIHEGAPGDEQESVDDTLLRVAGQNATTVELHENRLKLERTFDPENEEWIADTQLDRGENTTISARVISLGWSVKEFNVRYRGGIYDSGRTYKKTVAIGGEQQEAVKAYPRFDAGGVHAVTGSGRFLGFVNVSSPNVSVTSVGELPDTVYEGTEHALDVTVANTGGETERFAVTTATSPSGESTPGWTDTRIVTLGPEETRTVQRPVRFHTRGDQTVSVNENWSRNVTVEHPVSVTDSRVVGSEHYTSQYVTMTATLTNGRETTAEKVIDVSLWQDGSGELRTDASGVQPRVDLNDSRTVSVPGGESKTVTFRRFLEFPGTYNASVTSEPVRTVDVAWNPVSPTNLSVPADEMPNGSEVSVDVTLTNDGSTTTNRHVALFDRVPENTWKANVSLAPEETTTETFTLAVPTRGQLSVYLDSDQTLRDSFRVPTPNLSVNPTDVPEAYAVSERLRMPVWLNNTGTTTERYQVPVVVTHDEFNDVGGEEILYARLSGQDTRRQTVDYEFGQPGNYTATVFGESVGNFSVTTPVEAVNGSFSNDTVEAGETTTFEGAFRNPTSDSQDVALTVPETDYESVKTLPANTTETVSWRFGFLQPGTYDVLVHGDAYQIDVTENESWSGTPSNGNDGGEEGGDGTDDSSSTENTGSSNGGTDGGNSDGQESSSRESSSTGGESTANETGVKSEDSVVRVNATTTTNGTMVAEASGNANETVVIEVSASNASGGNTTAGDTPDGNATAVTGVNVSLAANETFTVAVSTSEERPGTVSDDELDTGVEMVDYVNISHPELSEAEIASASFTVAVGTARLEAMDAGPETVSVYRYVDGWERVETTYLGRQGDAHAFRADTPGLSVFAVGVERQSTVTVADVGLSASQVSAGDAVTVDATVQNTGDAATTRQVEVRVGGESVAGRTVDLAAGERRTIRFDVTIDKPGEYAVAVNDEAAGTLVVQSDDESAIGTSTNVTGTTGGTSTETTGASTPGFGALAAVLAVVAALGVAAVRQRRRRQN